MGKLYLLNRNSASSKGVTQVLVSYFVTSWILHSCRNFTLSTYGWNASYTT